MKAVWIIIAAALLSAVSLQPCVAQTLQGDAAYQELLKLSDPSSIIAVGSLRYVRVPRGADSLPGGYNGYFDKTKLRLSNGQEIEVIDPAKPLRISKGGKPSEPSSGGPDRIRRIASALEKLGLHPKVAALPEAISGHRIDVVAGEMKPGGTTTQLFIHVGAASKVRQVFDISKQRLSDNTYEVARKRHQPNVVEHFIPYAISPYAPSQLWNGVIWYPINSDDSQRGGSEVAIGGSSYLLGSVQADCLREDVLLTVAIRHYDTSPNPPKLALMIDDADRKRTRARSVELAAIIRPQVENWMKILVKTVDEVDGTSPPAVAAAQPPVPKPPQPLPPTARPAANVTPPAATRPTPAGQLTPAELAILRNVIKAGRGASNIIPLGLQDMARNLKDAAISHPWQSLGGVIAGIGVVGVGVGSFPVWVGLGFLGSGGLIATYGPYHDNKPKDTLTELAPIRDARTKIQKVQKDWKRDFTDAELNELGIVMNDLSQLTREQRAQVYKDAGIEFQSRAEAYLALREELQRERGGR